MLEWLKRHAWKACKRQKRFPGSNPGLSAKNGLKISDLQPIPYFCRTLKKVGKAQFGTF